MSSTDCLYYEGLIKTYKPDKKVLVYTGNSSDNTKNDLKDCINKWKEADVLIYSPTIEAGVNFDLDHFDKMYGIICGQSTSPRAFLQMLARIRKLKDTNITILNERLIYRNIFNNQFYKFNEVKEAMMLLDDIKISSEIVEKDGKMYKANKMKAYDTNYIYNKLENLNSSPYYFLATLEKLCINKGHTFEINEDKEDKDEENILEKKPKKKDMILSYPDIDDCTYDDLKDKQKRNEATKEDKEKISKHYFKKIYGVDSLNEDILNIESHQILNFMSLIDESNIKYSKDNQTKEQHKKVEIINKLLSDLTFENVFDDKKISKPEFLLLADKAIKDNTLFTDKNIKVLFNINKADGDVKTNKKFLGYINAILDNYSIKISYEQVRIKGQKERIGIYKLVHLNNINEVLEYKIRKGFRLCDEKKIRKTSTTEIYKDLVDWTKKPVIQNKFIDDIEEDMKENPLDYGIVDNE